MEITPYKTKTLTFTNGEVRRVLAVFHTGTAIRKLVYNRLKLYEKTNIIGFTVDLRSIKPQDSLSTIALRVEVYFN